MEVPYKKLIVAIVFYILCHEDMKLGHQEEENNHNSPIGSQFAIQP